MIQNQEVFVFCAIPQVMAIETLCKVYNNSKVFTSVQKVRKGRSCVLMLETRSMSDVRTTFDDCLADMHARIPSKDPNSYRYSSDFSVYIFIQGAVLPLEYGFIL